MRPSSHRSRASGPRPGTFIETLEHRTLRSATLIGHELHVTGTSKADLISIYLEKGHSEKIDVKIGRTVASFNKTDVSSIWVNGGAGDDRISIDQGNGVIKDNATVYGGLGDDSIRGGSGRDRIICGAGDDSVNGASGSDIIYGDAGDDSIRGDAGNDFISGGDDNDSIDGDSGDDRCLGGNGADHLNGEIGDDSLLGGDGNDSINGGAGNDSCAGEIGDDSINGDAGDDSVFGGGGIDDIHGGSGHDHFGSDDDPSERKDEGEDDLLDDHGLDG